MKNKKYLKVYTTLTSGTMAGRDDGYPEDKMGFVNEESMAKNYNSQRNERYFEVRELSKEEVQGIVKPTLERLEEKTREEKKQSIENKILKLQEQLKSL